jgi:thiosulfate dehydrogenase (quinone) large subunit
MSSTFKSIRPKAVIQVPEPPIARFLFADTRMAWFWLIVRLYVGYEWLVAGVGKLFGFNIDFTTNTFWTGNLSNSWIFTSNPGAGLAGMVKGAIAQSQVVSAHPAVQGWYGWFLQVFVQPYTGFWAYVVTFGEVFVGLGLILGVLTGIAAFFGVFMNMNFLLLGAVSINPIIGGLGLFLILAWRVAGYYGVDRWLLPLLGTPWTGTLTRAEYAKPKQPSPPVPSAG